MVDGLEIVAAQAEDIDTIRDLWTEYWIWPLEFQGFGQERASLPGVYVPPHGRLLLARMWSDAAGTIALRRLSETACEVKRLFVRPRYRGQGVARALLHRVIEEARDAGYAEMFCDTQPDMTPARQLYTQAGFFEVGPYSPTPTEGAVYFRLGL